MRVGRWKSFVPKIGVAREVVWRGARLQPELRFVELRLNGPELALKRLDACIDEIALLRQRGLAALELRPRLEKLFPDRLRLFPETLVLLCKRAVNRPGFLGGRLV
jgi:hypothetical protein